MQLICPKCGSAFELEAAVAALEHREVADIAAGLGSIWRVAYEYTDCFRVSEYGDVRPRRRWALLKEIAALFDTGIFRKQGKRYRTTRDEIGKGMVAMCNRNIWGVKSHGYLFAILVKTGERLSAEGLTAREEREREGQRTEDRGQRTEEGRTQAGQKLDYTAILDSLDKGDKK